MLAEIATWLFGPGDEQDDAPFGDDADRNGLIDLQCGRTVFNDVPAKMRTELWLSQLHRERGKGAAAIAQYPILTAAPLSSDVLAEIDKDTHRTFPGHPWLKGRAGQLAMLRVLRAYAALDPEVGYSQGMNFLAGLLLTYLDEAEAFGALAFIMQDRGLRDLYKPNGMALLQIRLWQLGRLMPPRLAAHMETHAVLPVLYASSWLLTCFAADFPLSFAARVMDLVVTDSYAAPLMKVAVHILERCSKQLLEMDDMEAMVHLLKQEVPRWPRSALQDLLTESLGRPWSARQSAVLKEINGAETVAEAVARVDAAAATGSLPSPVTTDTGEEATSELGGGRVSTLGSGFVSGRLASLRASSSVREEGVQDLQKSQQLDATVQLPKLMALPPPPRTRGEKVEWGKAQVDAPAFDFVPQASLRIESELREADLDPALSRALSTYASVAPKVAPPSSPQDQRPQSAEARQPAPPSRPAVERVVVPVTTPASPSALAHIPSPFQSMRSAGDHTDTSGQSLGSSNAFSEFTGATSASADASTATSQRMHSLDNGPSGSQGWMGTWGTAANNSVTHLLAGLSMNPSGHGQGATPPPPPRESLQRNVSEFGGWQEGEKPNSGFEMPSPQMTGNSSSRLEAATSRAVLLQSRYLQDFSDAAKTPPSK